MRASYMYVYVCMHVNGFVKELKCNRSFLTARARADLAVLAYTWLSSGLEKGTHRDYLPDKMGPAPLDSGFGYGPTIHILGPWSL